MIRRNSIIELLKGVKVEWRSLNEITNYEQPTKYLVTSTNYNDAYKTPVLTAGKTFILGYTNEIDRIYTGKNNPVIIFDDFTTANKWVNFDFKVKSSAMKIISSADEEKYHLKYIYYWMNTLPNEKTDNNHKRQWISNYANKKIPVPPFSIQIEIVRILDTFAALTAELTAELTTRKKQYNYYRDKLLSFKEDEVEWKLIREIAILKRGVRVVRNQLSQKTGYHVYQNSLIPLGYYEKANTKENTTFIISAGAAGEIGYSSEIFWAADDCLYFECSKHISSRYLFYVLKNKQEYILSQVRRSSIPRLSRTVIEKLSIPIPPLEEQARIVEILDKFDALTTSITEGLPREIELRQKQYEYYRNLLLDFPKVQKE